MFSYGDYTTGFQTSITFDDVKVLITICNWNSSSYKGWNYITSFQNMYMKSYKFILQTLDAAVNRIWSSLISNVIIAIIFALLSNAQNSGQSWVFSVYHFRKYQRSLQIWISAGKVLWMRLHGFSNFVLTFYERFVTDVEKLFIRFRQVNDFLMSIPDYQMVVHSPWK